ncbi:hypothetical protein SI65_02905 [Aspergillus cristatus]|uniref:Uncharacterized protein n=1 Tax=Aspergillus cristatus TaxID=573508 RepID=A0A1E3BM99_ASPCR|nr:hypothetical protein SI65_02905 [Aspergillus cristatus]
MPSMQIYEHGSFPEARGLIYDESEMALFRAKLSYQSTIDARMASKDPNLAAIAETQARILKRWEMLKHIDKEAMDNGTRDPTIKTQMAQHAWRYKQLEEVATKTGA